METSFIVAQVFGLLASLVLIASVQFKKKEHILILIIASSILFVVNFILLEAYSGAACCVVGALIALIVFIIEKLGHKANLPLIVVFTLSMLIVTALAFEKPWDILPVIGEVFWLVSLLQSDENRLRWLMIGNCVAWLIYGIATTAYMSVLADVFTIASIIIALVRYRGK
jgi:hypothetical protein